jgi:hypothetical protein
VDVINAAALGRRADVLEGYYAANVIGGEVGGVPASASGGAADAGVGALLTAHLTGGIEGGAVASQAVPEPGPAVVLLGSLGVIALCSRSRR